MITVADIMAGKIPARKKTFSVQGVGEIELHSLTISMRAKALEAVQPSAELPVEEIEKTILDSVYYMLNGESNTRKAQKLKDVLDDEQLGQLFKTGLLFSDDENSKEQTEKN